MGVAGIPGQHHARCLLADLVGRDIVERIRQAMSDLVDRMPDHLLHIEGIGLQDPLRLGNDVVDAEATIRSALFIAEPIEFDIEPNQIATLARQQQDRPFAGRLDDRLHAEVWEVCDGKNIHHAPRLMRRVAMQRAADGLAHGGARTIAAHDIARPDHFGLSQLFWRGVFERDDHRIVRGRAVHLQ